MIFYINHFSLIVIYYSVLLGFKSFGAILRPRAMDMTINPQIGNEAVVWMMSCLEQMVLRI